MIGVLDDIAFEVSEELIRTWQEAKRSGAARWHVHEVYKGKPKSEFLGPGLDSMELPIPLWLDQGVIPRDELRKLRDKHETGAVLQFTVGGQLVGDFKITRIEEDLKRFSNTGVLLHAVATISIEEYV